MFYLTTHSTHFIYGYMASDIWLRTIQIVSKRERERNVLFNDALNTFYLRLYGVRHMVKNHSDSEKGRKEMFYLTTHSTHFIYDYMASDIWLRTILILRKGNPLPPHRLLFPINSKGSFICTIPQTG